MSADENLNPRQFGKYTVRPVAGQGRTVEAVVGKTERRVGAMTWEQEHKNRYTGEVRPPTIFKVVVHQSHRRKGVASALLSKAREMEPGIQHSTALSDDGRAWAEKTP
jgi:GNAT superfamily N-acetyltransferase